VSTAAFSYRMTVINIFVLYIISKIQNKSFFTQRFYTYIGTCENRDKLNYMYNVPRVIKIKKKIF